LRGNEILFLIAFALFFIHSVGFGNSYRFKTDYRIYVYYNNEVRVFRTDCFDVVYALIGEAKSLSSKVFTDNEEIFEKFKNEGIIFKKFK